MCDLFQHYYCWSGNRKNDLYIHLLPTPFGRVQRHLRQLSSITNCPYMREPVCECVLVTLSVYINGLFRSCANNTKSVTLNCSKNLIACRCRYCRRLNLESVSGPWPSMKLLLQLLLLLLLLAVLRLFTIGHISNEFMIKSIDRHRTKANALRSDIPFTSGRVDPRYPERNNRQVTLHRTLWSSWAMPSSRP